MAENHVAGKAAMGQLRKVSLTEVSGGWFEQQTAGSWQAHLVSYKDPRSPPLLSGANLSRIGYSSCLTCVLRQGCCSMPEPQFPAAAASRAEPAPVSGCSAPQTMVCCLSKTWMLWCLGRPLLQTSLNLGPACFSLDHVAKV